MAKPKEKQNEEKLDIVKDFIVNSIIADTYDSLVNEYKPDWWKEEKINGIPNLDKLLYEYEAKLKNTKNLQKILFNRTQKLYEKSKILDDALNSVKKNGNPSTKDRLYLIAASEVLTDNLQHLSEQSESINRLDDFVDTYRNYATRYKESKHEQLAQTMMQRYLDSTDITGISKIQNVKTIISEMRERIQDNNIDEAYFKKILKKHLENGMKKFSEAECLRKN